MNEMEERASLSSLHLDCRAIEKAIVRSLGTARLSCGPPLQSFQTLGRLDEKDNSDRDLAKRRFAGLGTGPAYNVDSHFGGQVSYPV